jgi:F-type H+-transporting ATPase subunit delta
MSSTRIASRYAKSLFDVALQQGRLEEARRDVDAFNSAMSHNDLRAAIKSPVIKADKKIKIFDAVFTGFDAVTRGFVHLIINKGREEFLAEIMQSFIEQYRRHKNITTVKIKSAVPFSNEALQKIVERLKANGIVKGEAEVESSVDPDVIGGFILQLDDKIYDASVDYKLDQLRRKFSENVYSKGF